MEKTSHVVKVNIDFVKFLFLLLCIIGWWKICEIKCIFTVNCVKILESHSV